MKIEIGHADFPTDAHRIKVENLFTRFAAILTAYASIKPNEPNCETVKLAAEIHDAHRGLSALDHSYECVSKQDFARLRGWAEVALSLVTALNEVGVEAKQASFIAEATFLRGDIDVFKGWTYAQQGISTGEQDPAGYIGQGLCGLSNVILDRAEELDPAFRNEIDMDQVYNKIVARREFVLNQIAKPYSAITRDALSFRGSGPTAEIKALG